MAQREDNQPHEHGFQKVTAARRPAGQPRPKHRQREGGQAEAERDNAAGLQVILEHLVDGQGRGPKKIHEYQDNQIRRSHSERGG